MLSRACAGTRAGQDHRLAAGIGECRAARHDQAADTRAGTPRARALTMSRGRQRARGPRDSQCTRMRPFGDVISLEAARAILDATGDPIDRTETVAARRCERSSRRSRRDRARWMCRRFRARAWTATPCAPSDTRGATRAASAHADESRDDLHGRGLARSPCSTDSASKSPPARRCRMARTPS